MVSVSVTIERCLLDSAEDILCSRCHEPLTLHQPDVDMPEQMLGTCDECKSWYLIDKAGGIMSLLPEERTLRRRPRSRR